MPSAYFSSCLAVPVFPMRISTFSFFLSITVSLSSSEIGKQNSGLNFALRPAEVINLHHALDTVFIYAALLRDFYETGSVLSHEIP